MDQSVKLFGSWTEGLLSGKTHPESVVRRYTFLLASATLVFACMSTIYLEFKSRSAHMAMSNLPLAVLLPLVFWLLGNVLFKRFFPILSLTSSELRLLFCVVWIGGSFAGYNWSTQWVGTMVGPRYFASPENRWEELVFDYLPWWLYPSNHPGVVENFYMGLEDGGKIPWSAWLGPIFSGVSVAVAMTTIGVGITAIFQKQWIEHERLAYPLSQASLELTEGFDRQRGWAPFVCSWTFWFGFGIAAIPLLWNIVEYFVLGFPRIPIFDAYFGPFGPMGFKISRYLPAFSYRLLPTVMGFTFLCDLNILFSIWSLYLVGLVIRYAMNRTGFSLGLAGQEANTGEILGLFSHGVMLGLVLAAIWVARGHLRWIGRQVWCPSAGERQETEILSPRGAVICFFLGTTYMVFWLYQTGYSLTMGAVWLGLLWVSIFAVMKFLAATGFAYLFPNWGWGKAIPEIWGGTIRMSDPTLVAMRVVNWRLMPGWRLPMVLPHIKQLYSSHVGASWMIFGSVLLGALTSGIYTIWICYVEGGATFRTWSLVGAPKGMYNGIASAVSTERTVTDPAKILVWVVGIAMAGTATLIQTRIPWWPIHPLGFMLMFDQGFVRLYVVNIFLVWLAKRIILQFGGIQLYQWVKPVFYGLIVGYPFAAGCSFLVDFIWFSGGGHYIHGY